MPLGAGGGAAGVPERDQVVMSADSSKICMPPNWRSPDCPATFRIEIAVAHPGAAAAEADVVERLKAFCSLRRLLQRRTEKLPQQHLDADQQQAGDAGTMPADARIEMPVARITVISLPRASVPSPSSEPMSAVIGQQIEQPAAAGSAA